MLVGVVIGLVGVGIDVYCGLVVFVYCMVYGGVVECLVVIF